MLWEALPKVDDGSPSSITMSNRLAVLVAPFVFLGLGYFVFIKFAYEEKQHVEPLHVPDEVSVVPSVPGGHEGDSPIDEEGSRETVPVAASVFPDVHITEFPGRRLVVSGRMSNVVGRTKVLEAIANDLGESFVIDDQVKLDFQCEPFSWGSRVEELDFTEIQKVRNFDLQLTNARVTLSGEVFSQQASANVAGRVQSRLPREVSFEDALKTVAKPEASFSVWAAPDRTFLVSGTVPEASAEAYVKLIQDALPGMPVINDLIEDRFVQKPDWGLRVKAFLPGFLNTTQRASLKIDSGNHVKLEGLAQSRAIANMRTNLRQSFPKPMYDLQVDLQLGVPTNIKVTTPDSSKAPMGPVARTVPEMIGSYKVYFRSGRSRVSQLDSSEVAKLDRLGRQWRKENFNQKVYVFGFTDSSGDPGTNAYFSETRCSNVVTYLKKKYNIDASLFEVMGTPPDHPKESGTADELRRVEFSLTNQPSQAPETNWAATSAGPSNVLKPVVAAELFSQSKEIFFGSGKVTASAEDRESLFQLGSALALEKNKDMIIVYGYADSKGKAAANKWFTEERCKAVRDELMRGGVPGERIIMRPILPAKVSEPASESPPKKQEDEDDEEPETVNPRKVQLVMMERAAYDKIEAEKEAAAEAEKEAAAEAEEKAAAEAEKKAEEDAIRAEDAELEAEDAGQTKPNTEPIAEEMITPGSAFNTAP